MALVIGGDRDGVEGNGVEHGFGVQEDVREAMLLRDFAGARRIDVTDGDKLGFGEQRNRLGMDGADPAASDEPKSNLLRHRFPVGPLGQSSSSLTRLLRQRARKDFRTALSGDWIVRPPSTVRTAPVTKDASSEARYKAAFATSSGEPHRPIG
jgi:hypothetical protein